MRKVFLISLLVIILLLVFLPWVFPNQLVGGDTVYTFQNMIGNYPITPLAWFGYTGNGFGSFVGPFIFTQPYTTLLAILVSVFHLSFSTAMKLVLAYPFLILSVVSSGMVYQRLFGRKFFWIFASGIFTLNTYILMLVSGGQFPVAIAYACLPLCIYFWLQFPKEPTLKTSWFFILIFSLQIFSDIRIVYITILALVLLTVFFITDILRNIWKSLLLLFIMCFFVVGLQAFWLLPTVVVHQNPLQHLGNAYTTSISVQFLSFAKFEDAMGLLHPNWPENIFGLTHFMRPEFLLLPILVFASLLFVKPFVKSREEKRNILFFALLGLVGIFFSKGANDPFGGIYLWMFDHVPGFIMFRDPTKWYILIALSYAMLIPFTVEKIYEWIKLHSKFSIFNFQFSIKSKIFSVQNVFLLGVIIYLLSLIHPALLGQLGGTFKAHTLPQDYINFERFMSSQHKFSRTMWIPSLERYGFNSTTHPAVGAEDFYHVTSISGVLDNVRKQDTENKLQERSIAYIVIPYDVEKEIFLKDRKYDPTQYTAIVDSLRKISWLKELPGFGRIHVFVLRNTKDHFWISDQDAKITYYPLNPTKYKITLQNAKKGDRVVFTDTFDSNWQFIIGNQKIASVPFENSLNSFVLPKEGNYTAIVYFTPQTWVTIGLLISAGTATLLLSIYIWMFLG